jgi:hypothetical protein
VGLAGDVGRADTDAVPEARAVPPAAVPPGVLGITAVCWSSTGGRLVTPALPEAVVPPPGTFGMVTVDRSSSEARPAGEGFGITTVAWSSCCAVGPPDGRPVIPALPGAAVPGPGTFGMITVDCSREAEESTVRAWSERPGARPWPPGVVGITTVDCSSDRSRPPPGTAEPGAGRDPAAPGPGPTPTSPGRPVQRFGR